ncbi:hypothetical protein [Pseudoalteromonas marina]|uniref:Uncharacterized protein n=1 Tax=Pseudoalteromonas marina TaxID=267375 RepID=A0ABT9FC08_9GAMM|nr:hypothetical protein [Pseudoalteromonas marina]MDP2564307.1 hypothetical protein [Pseudoalteromonas marina]
MKRIFLKNTSFAETNACFIGENYVGNGHWLLHLRCASNRRHFVEEEKAKAFIKDTPEVIKKENSIEDIIEEHTVNNPLKEARFSDICIGEAALIVIGDELHGLKAAYANALKDVWGPGDKLMGNDKIVVAFNDKGDPGLVIATYIIGDLKTSIRNIEVSRFVFSKLQKVPNES